MKRLLPVLLFTTSTAHATSYYVANNGNDANNGLTPTTAWQTINKVNTATFANNDSVLFKRGNVFRGAVSSNKFPLGIRYDAYGTGANPVIAGSIKITNWNPSALGANIYEADVSTFIKVDSNGVENTIENLFVNGKLMTIARYPNVTSPDKTNWLKVGATAGTNSFTDPVLAAYNKPIDYWKDATLRIRTYSWTYKVFPITASLTNGKITATGLGTQLPEWGYFIDGKLSELDYPGEWYYDANVKKVYLYPIQAVHPNTLLVEGSTYKTGINIYWHEHNSVIKNLTFRHFIDSGVNINSSDNVKVQNCRFEYNLSGISVWNAANLLISGNTFEQQLSTGISLSAASYFSVINSVIEKNKITNTGMIPLYCRRYSGVCYGIGMSVFGKGFIIRQNVLENTGWTGMYLKDGGSHVVENNVIRKALSLLNDGGAVAVGSNDNVIRGNFLLDSVGNVDQSNGCGSTATTPCMHHASYGMGVGADNNYKNIVVESNTIAGNNDWAIRFNAFTNSKIMNNTLFNNESQITLEDTHGLSANNVVSGNIVYSAMPDQIAIKMTNATEHGVLNSNYYCNPYSAVLFNRNKRNYAFEHWRTAFNQDSLSKQCTWIFTEYATTATGIEMLSNTTFDTNVNGWSGGTYEPTTTGMIGGSLKYTNKATTGFVSHNNLPLQAEKFYRLRFRLKGSAFGNVDLRINDTTDYANLAGRFFAYSTQAKDYEFVFKASRTTAKGQVVFVSRDYDAPFYWLDNVSLMPVTAQLAAKPAQLLTNDTAIIKSVPLVGNYVDLDGQAVGTSVDIAPFSSRILIKL